MGFEILDDAGKRADHSDREDMVLGADIRSSGSAAAAAAVTRWSAPASRVKFVVANTDLQAWRFAGLGSSDRLEADQGLAPAPARSGATANEDSAPSPGDQG
jgi:hypothetical protein